MNEIEASKFHIIEQYACNGALSHHSVCDDSGVNFIECLEEYNDLEEENKKLRAALGEIVGFTGWYSIECLQTIAEEALR